MYREGRKRDNLSKEFIDVSYIANQRRIVGLQVLYRLTALIPPSYREPPGHYRALCTILSRLMNATFVWRSRLKVWNGI